MLKKFLQFLKGNEQDEISGGGSYLDQLLEKVRPIVAHELEDCPEHDPLLVLVVSILRTTMPDRWDTELPCPLSDTQSPPLEAPQPPPEPLDENVEEFEEIEDASIVEESVIEEEPQPGEASLSEESSVVEGARIDDDPGAIAEDEDRGEDGEVGDSEEVSGEDEEGEASDASDADDVSIVEDQAASPEEADASDIDDTQEPSVAGSTDGSTEAPGLSEESVVEAESLSAGADSILEESSVTLDLDEPGVSEKMDWSLDAPEVLQTGRVFLGMLIENDRMPVEMQMSVAETMLARDLLLGYFLGSPEFEGKARELLTIVEEKFSDGAFSQARILLQLFQTDRKTQVNNARNLFYEDMILRMGIRRRNRVRGTMSEEFEANLGSCETLNDRLVATTEFFREQLHVKFHLFARDSEGVEVWNELAERSRRRNASEQLLRYLPPKRWRPMNSFPNSPSEVVHAHISQATIRKYVLRQIKACYFVLRAVGDTGLEPYLDVFFNWSEAQFGVNGVQLMPMIYRRTMSDAQLVEQIFEGVYDTFYADAALDFLRGLKPDRVEKAVESVIQELTQVDYDELAPGHYDFGGLIFDKLLNIEYPDDEFGFKLHRLT
ncbi:MAG: hypothetical protein ACQEVA_10775 [Myxococcota bacterium]